MYKIVRNSTNTQSDTGIVELIINFEKFMKYLTSSMEWLTSIYEDTHKALFSSLEYICKIFDNIENIPNAYKNKKFLRTLYDCKWFPYFGQNVNTDIFIRINKILESDTVLNKQLEEQIDNEILSYFTEKELLNIKSSWENSNLKSEKLKGLCQAIDAHVRGEYFLTVHCLSSMWESLIKEKAGVVMRQKTSITTMNFKNLISNNGFDDIFGNFYEKRIVNQCDSPDDIIEGVPNRHAYSHSLYKKSPDIKTSLNAILITNFIIDLEPSLKTEAPQNGQTENLHA